MEKNEKEKFPLRKGIGEMGKKWLRKLLRRRFFIILLLVFQLSVLIYTLVSSSLTSEIIKGGLTVFSIVVCLYIISSRDKGAYKLTWVFQILLFPVFGGLFYLLFNFQSSTRKYRKRIAKAEEKAKQLLLLPDTGYDEALLNAHEHSPQIKYLQIMNNAKDYVYINTPYLIIDSSVVSALCLAAKSGVDVRIVTPHIWDKWIVHMTTRSYYRELIDAGVRIYEYSKGFIHSKTFVSDDTTATVGTTNLDFRSLYLHFECGVWMYQSTAVMEVKDDFLRTLDACQEITAEDCKCSIPMRIFQDVLRVFAPLI